MTKPLTPEQLKFLNDYLSVRPSTKTPLKGRKLSKIKDQYSDYLRRCRECDEVIRSVEDVHGRKHTTEFWKDFDSARDIVAVGANTGDETVFATAYKRLESVKKDAKASLKELDDEASAIEKASVAFEKALAAMGNAEPKKQPGLAQALVARCLEFLSDRSEAVAPRVTAVLEQAQQASGTPLKKADMLVVGTQLANETGKLFQHVKDVLAKGSVDDSDKQAVQALLSRLRKAKDGAEKSGSIVATGQIKTAITQLEQAELLIDPPPLKSKIDESEDDSISEEDLVEKVETEIDDLVDHAKDEAERVSDALEKTKDEFDDLQQELGGSAASLSDEINLIKSSLETAGDFLQAAEDDIKTAIQGMPKDKGGKMKESDWQDAVETATGNCDQALANVSAADKAVGRAEGGVIFVRNKVAALTRIPERIETINQDHVAAVTANVGVLGDCDRVPNNAGDIEILKHLAIVSADAATSQTIIGKITDAGSYDKQIQELMKSPKLGTQLVTQLMVDCQAIVNDCERYLGDVKAAKKTLAPPLQQPFERIIALATNDAARFTVPVISRKSGDVGDLQSVGVAVVGGGPIGLLAAVEARMAGASQVHVYEGRTDAYSRMNVIKIDDAAIKRLTAAGIIDQCMPDRGKKQAAVKDIENALEERCGSLGIKLERDRFLIDVKRDTSGIVNLTFKDDPTKPRTCDFLIVATGGSVAGAQKHADNVVLGDKLGVAFQKAAVKDYAAVGLFTTTAQKDDPNKQLGWQYAFETTEAQYVVSQLTEEEFRDMGENPRKLVERIQATRKGQTQTLTPQAQDDGDTKATIGDTGTDLQDAIETSWTSLLEEFKGIDNFYGKDKVGDDEAITKSKTGALNQLRRTIQDRSKKGGDGKVSQAEVEKSLLNFLLATFGVSRFPIELQQASTFTTKDGAGVLVGDSAATPHPSTAKGLNTGIAEMGAMRDLIQDLQRTGGDEKKREEALKVYDFEVKRRTDVMIDEGLETLQAGTKERIVKMYHRRISPQLGQWGGGSSWGGTWLTKLDTHITGLRWPKDKAGEDLDWKLREAAVKALRDLQKKVETAETSLKQENDTRLQGRNPPVDDNLPDELKKILTDIVPV